MAHKQNQKVKARDINPLFPPGLELDMDVVTRLSAIEFDPDGSQRLVFSTTVSNGEVSEATDGLTIHLQLEAQPGDPPEDVLDDDGNVVIAAGEFSPSVPSLADVLARPLAGGPKPKTIGELLDLSRRVIYLTVKQLDPRLADGVEE
mgnify:CR=1 FL=1